MGGEAVETAAAARVELGKRTRQPDVALPAHLHQARGSPSPTNQELGRQEVPSETPARPLLGGPGKSAHSIGHARPGQPSLP